MSTLTSQLQNSAKAVLDVLNASLDNPPTFRDYSDAVSYANNLASLTGESKAYAQAARVAERCEEGKDVIATFNAWAVSTLSRAAADRWSGRGNDAARAEFDGTREAVEQILSIVERSAK